MHEKAAKGTAVQVHLQLYVCSTQPAHYLVLPARTHSVLHSLVQVQAKRNGLGVPACQGHQQLSSGAHEHMSICGGCQIRRDTRVSDSSPAQQGQGAAAGRRVKLSEVGSRYAALQATAVRSLPPP